VSVSDLLNAVYRGDDAARDAILAERDPADVFEAAAVGDVARLAALLDEGDGGVGGDYGAGLVGAVSVDGFTPLHLAAFFRHPDAVALLIGRDADVDAVAANPMRVRPLHSAAAGGDPDAVRLLVEAGADVNAVQHGGYTPLHALAQHGDADGAALLLARGADAGARTDDGRTPADLAAAAGHAALAERLAG
jgi:ankyrin repeat protein